MQNTIVLTLVCFILFVLAFRTNFLYYGSLQLLQDCRNYMLNFTWKAVVHQRQGSKVEGTTLLNPQPPKEHKCGLKGN
jgi:hypothetical protein